MGSISMNRLSKLLLALCLLLFPGLGPVAHAGQTAAATQHSFRAEGGKFLLDGKPFRIISGEMHYPRIPRAYWRARLRMARAMGLNTITTYVFWIFHEPRPGEYDFSGQHDVAEFIREAQSEGLYVILRPGPYVCAEWEWGGYPAWLLKDHDVVVRSSDPRFMEPARRWLMRLGKELAPLQIGNGGPIIAVQVENEYGSLGNDHEYMEQIHHAILDAGFNKALLYTADGPEQLPNGSLPELPAVINFGPGEAKKSFATLRRLRPEGPFMTGEYWAGWFDHWGEKHHTTDAKQQADELAWMLAQGYSVSIYMFHGGTSFGWMNGANSNGKNYEPDVTSYDYDAPLNESGHPTPKFYLFRDVIAKATGITPPPVPKAEPLVAIAAFQTGQYTSLWQNLPAPVHSDHLLTMEDLGQAYGYILYRAVIPKPVHGELVIEGLHDYARIYANGEHLASLDRRNGEDKWAMDLNAPNTQLDILVENTGRVNFSMALRGERKGITGKVTLAGQPLTGWQIYSLPMNDPAALHFTNTGDCPGPCFYRGTFNVDKPADTYLDTRSFSKGFVWVNGHPLGRIWDIGPQQSLYLPAPWLHKGANDVIVLDLPGGSGSKQISGSAKPILDETPFLSR
jgi:beta-galactosidase